MEENYLMEGCLPLVLKFLNDATQTGASRSRCPVVMTVANLPSSLQASDRGKTCIGYIPILKGLGTTGNNLGKARKKIFHEVAARACITTHVYYFSYHLAYITRFNQHFVFRAC